MKPITRKQLFRWAGWFITVNVMICLLVCINYLRFTPSISTISGAGTGQLILSGFFIGTALITQVTFFVLVFSLPMLLAIAIVPWRWLAFSLAIISMAILLFCTIADSVTFGLYHLHYAKLGYDVAKAHAVNAVILLSKPEQMLIPFFLISMAALEGLLVWLTWRRVSQSKGNGRGAIFASVVGACTVASYSMMAMATTFANDHLLSTVNRHSILRTARVVPYFSNLYMYYMPGKYQTFTADTQHGPIHYAVHYNKAPLHYPLQPITATPHQKPLNVIILAIDTWRYEAMNPTVAPHIYRFAQKTIQFDNHWSGGNCTRPGLFSLFYSLPANYWHSALVHHTSPVLIDELLKQHYQMGVFLSAPMTFPPFNKTIFSDLHHIHLFTPGANTVDRDVAITKEFKKFIQHHDKRKPIFSFVFYDAVHNYCESTTPHQSPFTPAIKSCDRFSLTSHSDPTPYLNRYHNAVHFDDAQLAEDLAAIKKAGLMKNSIIIITADHGEQINDQRMGYWDHASAYTPYQVHIPMLVYWPGKKPHHVHYLTTHFDFVPTIMADVLGVHTPTTAYGVGHSLFMKGHRPFIVAGSYGDYAVISAKQVTRIYPSGDYEINSRLGHHLKGQSMQPDIMKAAYKQLQRYY